jgi:hypothetical protein
MEQYGDKTAWGGWLRGVLADRLAGTGLRPEVEYLPAEYEPVRDFPGRDPVPPRLAAPERYVLRIVCPLEWRVTNRIPPGDGALERAVEITDAVLAFYRDAWPERMCTDYMYDIFRRVPGLFEWTSERAPEILYRVTMARITQEYGSRSVRGITLYEDLLVVHTRWAGDFYIDMDNYRARLDEVLHAMRAFMRKPLRHSFLYRLRHGQDTEK